MSILSWILFGALVGWIASLFNGENGGCLSSILVGIGGALLGGFLFSLIGGTPVTGFNLWSIFVAVVGALLLTAILRVLRQPSRRTS